jgi:hypothetical protein
MVKTQQFSNGQNAEVFEWFKRKILKSSKDINGKAVKMKKKNLTVKGPNINRLKRKQG